MKGPARLPERRVLSIWRGIIVVPSPTPAQIKRRVAEEHGVSVEEIEGRRRYPNLVDARQQVMKEMADAGYGPARIGRSIGRRTHGAVIHGIASYEKRQAMLTYRRA